MSRPDPSFSALFTNAAARAFGGEFVTCEAPHDSGGTLSITPPSDPEKKQPAGKKDPVISLSFRYHPALEAPANNPAMIRLHFNSSSLPKRSFEKFITTLEAHKAGKPGNINEDQMTLFITGFNPDVSERVMETLKAALER